MVRLSGTVSFSILEYIIHQVTVAEKKGAPSKQYQNTALRKLTGEKRGKITIKT